MRRPGLILSSACALLLTGDPELPWLVHRPRRPAAGHRTEVARHTRTARRSPARRHAQATHWRACCSSNRPTSVALVPQETIMGKTGTAWRTAEARPRNVVPSTTPATTAHKDAGDWRPFRGDALDGASWENAWIDLGGEG